MFALLAMAGDLGGSIEPSTVGMISQKAGDNLQYGLFFGGIFPVVLVIFLIILKFMKKEYGVSKINLGHRKVNIAAARLYEKLGFVIVGEDEQDYFRTKAL